MADTPPGQGYVSGPYDHTQDTPPHQHGGTDAPECTTCRPSGKIDGNPLIRPITDEEHDRFVAKLTPVLNPEVFYYGTRGHDMGGRILRSLRERTQGLYESRPDLWHGEFIHHLPEDYDPEKWRKANMVIRDEHNREPYPGGDTPQLWSRRGLSEHIRLELQVLGLLPGPDGMVRAPEPEYPGTIGGDYPDDFVDVDLNSAELTPREQFEAQFGGISDAKWQWLKEFAETHWIPRGIVPERDRIDYIKVFIGGEWHNVKLTDTVFVLNPEHPDNRVKHPAGESGNGGDGGDLSELSGRITFLNKDQFEYCIGFEITDSHWHQIIARNRASRKD